ncbi:MAG: divalent metal cation transporter [Chloroflexi bacterium]|nr:MAG: divalent metal cation transporter [Chloroflexota bacterium]
MPKRQKSDTNNIEEGKPARKKTAPKKGRILKKLHTDEQAIEPGMTVEASEGDLGEADISKPRVKEVVEDGEGKVKEIVVSKGVVFHKKLDIPANRVEAVEQEAKDNGSAGKVIVAATVEETESLTAVGEEGLLDKVEQEIPTAEGLREREESNVARYRKSKRDKFKRAEPEKQRNQRAQAAAGAEEQEETPPKKKNFLLHVLGPGFLAGMAGNDASAITSYSVDGATTGYGHLWLLLLSTPLYQSVQFTCAKIGRITQMGLAEILRKHYSRWAAIPASLILILANIALVAADLVAIGSGLELFTGLAWFWFVVPVAIILWYLTVYRSFETIKHIFIAMSLAFVTYIITAIFSGANWQAVLFHTFVPQVSLSFASISSAVALLGATISPYTMFWQVQGEREEARAGTTKQKVRGASLDIAIGVVGGNLVSFFIIVCTGATLFTHHQNIKTATDAARALAPLVGPYAKYLFAVGLIGAGLVAIPVLIASTSYCVAGTFGWPSGLSKKPWQSEGFYLILTVGMLISLVVALLHFDPIQLMFWANVLNGVLSPVLVIYLIFVGNNRKIMRGRRMSWIANMGLVLTALVMFAAAALLFYGLATGQGG